jgi:hypothetical protein
MDPVRQRNHDVRKGGSRILRSAGFSRFDRARGRPTSDLATDPVHGVRYRYAVVKRHDRALNRAALDTIPHLVRLVVVPVAKVAIHDVISTTSARAAYELREVVHEPVLPEAVAPSKSRLIPQDRSFV